ncbi:hypothetical protein Clacol_005422 [Clathrus columnatus]|uniref:non-specific serine/threonine protein kinase n=1 Tax=Clathrus columnatus TaxID=1419009 RepID=A0AAV5AA26_9AGAM|nr:hypothetical protein Clacol_005422 [Clathrus columnatus]
MPSLLQLPLVPCKVKFEKGEILLHSVLSEGDYGCVYRGTFYVNGGTGECAAKCCLKSSVSLPRLMFFRREAVLHAHVSSGEGIVKLYDIFEDESFIWIIMKYYPEGDLWKAIVDGRFVGRDEYIRSIFSRILKAVAYCHSQTVYHRDIKPENILLDENGTKVFLADFGLASGVKCSESWGGIFGLDLPYEGAPHDIWSLGVVLINMICSNYAPWKRATSQDTAFRQFLVSPSSALARYPLSPQVCRLLERVFKVEPKQRITLKDFQSAITKIKVFSRQKEKPSRIRNIPRTVSGIFSYPFREKSCIISRRRLLEWTDAKEDSISESCYSIESQAVTDLSHCCVSRFDSELVADVEGPTVRLVGNFNPLYNARRVIPDIMIG